MAKTNNPVNEFIELTTGNNRSYEIAVQMNNLLNTFSDYGQWFEASLKSIPHNESERLFVAYMFGSFIGAEATQKQIVKKYGKITQ